MYVHGMGVCPSFFLSSHDLSNTRRWHGRCDGFNIWALSEMSMITGVNAVHRGVTTYALNQMSLNYVFPQQLSLIQLNVKASKKKSTGVEPTERKAKFTA